MKNITVLLLIPLVLCAVWFRNGLITGGGEEGILFYNADKTLKLSTSVWIEYGTGLYASGWLPRAPIMYLSFISEKNGIPPVIFQLILFYTLIVTGILSVYYLTVNLLDQYRNKTKAALISAIFYLFNPFAFSQIWGRSLSVQYFAFSLLPLTLLFFYLGIKRKKYIFGFLIAIISSLLAAAYVFLTFIIIYWFVIFIYFIFHILISRDKVREALFGIKFIIFTVILWIFINSWWFIPLLSSFGNVYSAGISDAEGNLGTLLGVSRSFTPDVIIRLLHKGYFFDSSAFSKIYSTLPFQIISFIPLCFVLVGLVKILRSQELIKFRFFVVLLGLGLAVSLGANPPLGWLFVWVFKHITPLQAFRNPFEKFGLVYALGYSAVFAYGLSSFLEKKRFKNLIIALVVVLTCGIYAWPMWTGNVIAGSDKKIGLDIPAYYKDLRSWLENRVGDYRLFMTPLWSGDGAYYQWRSAGRYQGSDPMIFMLDQPAISNGARIPFSYDFITNIRKYMQREDVTPALSLFRTKFLIDRKDAVFVTDTEKEQYKFLTSVIYPPQVTETSSKSICQNMLADSKSNGVAWLTCRINKEDRDLSSIKYLHLRLKTDIPAILQISLRDINDVRINWHGRVDADYRTDTNDWQYITIPLKIPTENDSRINLSKSDILEVWANSKDRPEKSVGEIIISEIRLDPGDVKEINEFKKVAQFDKLSVFELSNFNPPPELGSLSSVELDKDFVQLFGELNKKRNMTNKRGFVLISQNTQKNLHDLQNETSLQVTDKYKISDTRYWFKVNETRDKGLLLLSKTFDYQWKVIAGVNKEKLSGNFFDELNLLKAVVLPEDRHFVVNGYANLWIIDDQSEQYAIVFMPQIIADVSLKVSIFSLLVISGFAALNFFIAVRRNKSLNSI